MKPNATGLTRKQERAIIALLSEPGIDAAADACNVSRTTLWRWMQDSAFKAALLAARRETFGVATSKIAATSAIAADALRTVVSDPNAPPAARVSAAKVILERATAAIELDDLGARVAILEDREVERSEV